MTNSKTLSKPNSSFARKEVALRVRDAAVYLGTSAQTVYLWVERKQIPHHRVICRNIRFLKLELEPFRAIRTGDWEWYGRVGRMVLYDKRNDGNILRITCRNRDRERIRDSGFTEDWQEAQRQFRETPSVQGRPGSQRPNE